MITETKTQQKLVEESNKLSKAYKDMTEKERKKFYNIVRGQVEKQRKVLERIEDGKVSKNYKVLAKHESPALNKLREREGIIGKMPEEMPENFEQFQKLMESAKKFLTANTSTAKNWYNYLKDARDRTEKKLGHKFTIEEGRIAWELIDKLASTEGGGMYDASLSSEEGYKQVIAKVFDNKLSVDEMMANWEEYRKKNTPEKIEKDKEEIDVYSLAREQRKKLEKKKKEQEQNNYFKRR